MSLATFKLTPSSLVLIEGDSLNDPAFQFQMMRTVLEASRAFFNNGSDARRPRFVNKAINGSTIAGINGRLAAEIAQNPYTHIIICTGTNQRGVLRATTQANIATMLGLIPGNVDLLVVGPYAWGEKWPSGQNAGFPGADDTALDNTDIDLAAGVTGVARGLYVSLRTTLYTTIMPAINTPAPGAQTGFFTLAADGAHWNMRGKAAMWGVVGPYVSFGAN